MEPDVVYAAQVFRAAERAMERAASVAHEDLQHGLNTLATIASVAPLVGLLGALRAISFDTFRAVGTEKYTVLAMEAEGISLACVPLALGLLVGLQSLWAYRYLRDRLADFDREMADAPLDLVNRLALSGGRLRTATPIGDARDPFRYMADAYPPEAGADQRAWAAVALLLATWCMQVVVYFTLDAVPLGSAFAAGGRFVVVTFLYAYVPAYAVWVDLLHRKTRGVASIAAVLCLCWCAVGLVFPEVRF